MSENSDNFDKRFEGFAAQSLQNHAQILSVLNVHGDQLKDVKQKLDEHLYDHLQDLQKSLDTERTRSSKNVELWVATIVGAIGLVIALVALFKK